MGLPASPRSGEELSSCKLRRLDPFLIPSRKVEDGFLHHSLTVIDWLGTLLKNTACLGTLCWPSPAHGPAFITKGLQINTIHPARGGCPPLSVPTKPKKIQNNADMPSVSHPRISVHLILPHSSALRPSLFYPNNIYRVFFPSLCNVPHSKFQKYRKGNTQIRLESGYSSYF